MNRSLTTMLWITILLLPVSGGAQPSSDRAPLPLVDQVASVRLELDRLDKAVQALGQQRDQMATGLDRLAGEIAALKARRAQNPLLPEITLPQKLRRSQELSDTLTVLNRELESLIRIRRDKLQDLALSYDALVEQTLTQARSAEGERRKDLLLLLGQARRERESIRNELMPQKRSFQSFRPETLLASDDPDELGERADAIRDQQDRLRKELAMLDRRIAEVKAERRLDREMRDFITDQEIFDEGSRIMVVPRGPAADMAADPDGTRKDGSAEPNENGDPSGPPDSDWGGGEDGISGAYSSGSLASPDADPQAPLGAGADARQPLGVDAADESAERLHGETNLSGLKQKRTRLVEDMGRLDVLLEKVQRKIQILSER